MSREDIKELITTHVRRLQILREQAAIKGISVDPGVLIEIENITTEISSLQAELDVLDTAHPANQEKIGPLIYSFLPRVRHFVDRDEMRAQLKAELRNEEKVMIMVDGLAGIGKTSLVSKVVEEVGEEFEGIFYTKYAPQTDLDQLLVDLSYFLDKHGDKTLKSVVKSSTQQENKINLLIRALSQSNYLLIFDDLHELLDERQSIKDKDIQLLFEKLLSYAHNAKIIIISRIRPCFYRFQLNHAARTVDKIEPAGGIELLRLLGMEQDEEVLQRAYQLTAGHPLAMELLASLANVISLENILSDKQLFFENADVAENLLKQLYQTLTAEEQSLLRCISIFSHPVTKELIDAFEVPDPIPALTSLIRKSLITFDKKVYRLHDLVRDFSRMQLTAKERTTYHLKAAAYYERLEFKKSFFTPKQFQQHLEARYHYYEAGQIEKAASILADRIDTPWGFVDRMRMLIRETLNELEALPPTDERKLLMVDLLSHLSYMERDFSIDNALELCKRAEKILNTVENSEQRGNRFLYRALGFLLYHYKTLWDEAEAYLRRALEIGIAAGDTEQLYYVFMTLLNLYDTRCEPAKIEQLSKNCVEVCEQHGDLQTKFNILYLLYRIKREWDNAIAACEENLLLRKPDDLDEKTWCIAWIGDCLWQKQDYENALKRYIEYLQLMEKAGDLYHQAQAILCIGGIYREQGNLEAAERQYEEAKKIAQYAEPEIKREILISTAGEYERLGRFDQALDFYEEYLQMSREIGNLSETIDVLQYIGWLYFYRFSNLDHALKCFHESKEIAEKHGWAISIEENKIRIASVYREQANFDEALSIYGEVLRARTERSDKRRSIVLNYIGAIHCAKGEFQEAFKVHEESLELCERTKQEYIKPFTLNFLGEDYLGRGDYDKALTAFEESLVLSRSPFTKIEPLTNIARVYYCQNRLADALAKCEESLLLCRKYGGRLLLGKVLHLMSKIRLSTMIRANSIEQFEDAKKCIQEAVIIFKEVGSYHLPEAEKTLQQMQNALGERDSIRTTYYGNREQQ